MSLEINSHEAKRWPQGVLNLTMRIANEKTANNNNPALLFQDLISGHNRYSPMPIHRLAQN